MSINSAPALGERSAVAVRTVRVECDPAADANVDLVAELCALPDAEIEALPETHGGAAFQVGDAHAHTLYIFV